MYGHKSRYKVGYISILQVCFRNAIIKNETVDYVLYFIMHFEALLLLTLHVAYWS